MVITKKLYMLKFLTLFFFSKLTLFFTMYIPKVFIDADILIVKNFFLKYYSVRLRRLNNRMFEQILFNINLSIPVTGLFLIGYWPVNPIQNENELPLVFKEARDTLFFKLSNFIDSANFLYFPLIFYNNVIYNYKRLQNFTKKAHSAFAGHLATKPINLFSILSFLPCMFPRFFRVILFLVLSLLNILNFCLVLNKQ